MKSADSPSDAEPALDITGFDQTESFLIERGVNMSENASDTPETPTPARSQYELLSELGKGAMGLVHLAKDRDLQRKVAYKQLLTQTNRSALARFLREAQITAQLDHPHIVPIYGMEVQADGNLAYSMKLVEGKTFKELINGAKAFYDQGLRPDAEHAQPQLLDYFLKACDAVAYAHSKGVIHRDLKPANIMVGRYNEVYVMDWGIARVMSYGDDMPAGWVELGAPEGEDASDERTRAGQILGTPRYMSPQQAAGRNDQLDGRSDLFAMGLILYELLTLRPAFTGANHIDLLKRVLKADKDPWTAYHASYKIPAELQAIVDKATAQKAPDRYAGVIELANDLRRYLRGKAPLARPDNSWRKLVRWVGRHRELSLMILLGLIVLAALGVIGGMVHHQRVLEQVRQRESRLLGFVSQVSQQGQHTDIYFQKIEGLLQGLSKAATFALNHGQPSEDPWYINDPHQPKGKLFVTPDLIPTPYYGGSLSPDWPVFILPPGLSREAAAPHLRQLSPLRHTLKQVLMDSYSETRVPADVWNQTLANKGVPLMWSYICLKQGIEYFYPGHDEPTIGYDPRERPYYGQSLNKPEIVWGAPYDDPVGGLLIPCTQGVFDEQQRFLGTVGIDMRIDYIDKQFLRLPNAPAFQAGYLVNDKGQVVLRSGDAAKPKKRLDVTQDVVLKPYGDARVRAAIAQNRPGGQLTDNPDEPRRLTVYHRLSTLGWYYVVEADYERVLGGTP